MKTQSYYCNCSPAYIQSISNILHSQIVETMALLPKRETRSDMQFDLFWLLSSVGWSHDTVPAGLPVTPPDCFTLECTLNDLKQYENKAPCLTSETLGTALHADFAKQFDRGLVQIEAQFSRLEEMLRDFCCFRIAYAEKRLALGIEIVLVDPASFFAPEQNAVDEEQATFDKAKKVLNTIGLDCPIWLLGICET